MRPFRIERFSEFDLGWVVANRQRRRDVAEEVLSDGACAREGIEHVLGFSGSPRVNGNTFREVAKSL